MKKFNQLATKNYLVFLSSIKTKVAIKFPKKNFFTENRLGAERDNRVSIDQCHIHMCNRAVSWTSDVAYIIMYHRAEGIKGLKFTSFFNLKPRPSFRKDGR